MKKKIIIAALLGSLALRAARLKDLADVEGVRENQLVGYGLVVGLKGTGDRQQTIFPLQTLANMLAAFGVSVNPATMQVRNLAAVMVTATLPPFADPGGRLDVTVSSMGDAQSLQGGTLLLTELKGANGEVYATAQGPLSIGGLSAGGAATGVQVNHPNVGRITGGALVERAAPTAPPDPRGLKLQLRRPDFTTAARVAEALNKKFGAGVAHADNAALVRVAPPASFRTRPVEFIAEMEPVEVASDRVARVVLNERTGTVVIGKDVHIAPVAVLHGNLTVQVVTSYEVSQPGPLSPGQTTVVPQTSVAVKEEKARHILLKEGVSVEQLIKALIDIGSTPRDVIAIMQGIAAAGALDAELEVI
ncbi:MAG TPA: flagellar basal body P-ring protein FlgI [Bryobacterales bacterium]|nr:flagellar basal body P-ring protein FlgI [Bryobacterales bacterium]